MSLRLAALNPNPKKWVPPKSPEHLACFTVTECIRGLYGMPPAETITRPSEREARKIAVVIAKQIGVPADVVCECFETTAEEILLFQLEVSELAGRDPGFDAKLGQMFMYCRRCTGRSICAEPAL